jgi:hypothetical protein
MARRTGYFGLYLPPKNEYLPLLQVVVGHFNHMTPQSKPNEWILYICKKWIEHESN